MEIGDRIKPRREELGMSQEELQEFAADYISEAVF